MSDQSGQDGEIESEDSQNFLSFDKFLEQVPPSKSVDIDVIAQRVPQRSGIFLATPRLQLHCHGEECNGIRYFNISNRQLSELQSEKEIFVFLHYICANCRKEDKIFALSVYLNEDYRSGTAYKYGESPLYGPPTSSRLISLIGPDRDIFLKGRRCENQSLGIGAFVYYRRVVEDQKNRIFDEIIKVSEKIGAPEDILVALKRARRETQFSKALESAKDAIPQTLLINGQNPLTLLHSALSEGLHAKTDNECLEIAQAVRIVLGELSERLAQALKDEVELNSAVSRLMAKK